jgi:RNA polymerase sigma-70 factor (ECF subfamily)
MDERMAMGAMSGLWRTRRAAWPALLATLLAADDSDAAQATVGAAQTMAEEREDVSPGEFEAFFRQHERAVYACLWRLTGDAQSARDLTQETFLRAWRHYERVRDYEQPQAWLLRVATNLAISARRRDHRPLLSADALGDADAPARSDPTHHFAERDQVERALLALTPNQRAALTLREVYGFSCAEIGAALGLSRDAVKMALFRGREGFRRAYLRLEAADER